MIKKYRSVKSGFRSGCSSNWIQICASGYSPAQHELCWNTVKVTRAQFKAGTLTEELTDDHTQLTASCADIMFQTPSLAIIKMRCRLRLNE